MTKDEFGLKVTALQGRMYRIARSYLQGEQDCLDAISESILKAWQKVGSLRSEQYFATWLCRILIRECIGILRRQKRMIPMEEMPENSGQLEPANAELQQALDELPQKYRIVIVLHYMEGYNTDEIAHILRLSRGTVCSQLYYAREKLRGFLKEEVE